MTTHAVRIDSAIRECTRYAALAHCRERRFQVRIKTDLRQCAFVCAIESWLWRHNHTVSGTNNVIVPRGFHGIGPIPTAAGEVRVTGNRGLAFRRRVRRECGALRIRRPPKSLPRPVVNLTCGYVHGNKHRIIPGNSTCKFRRSLATEIIYFRLCQLEMVEVTEFNNFGHDRLAVAVHLFLCPRCRFAAGINDSALLPSTRSRGILIRRGFIGDSRPIRQGVQSVLLYQSENWLCSNGLSGKFLIART